MANNKNEADQAHFDLVNDFPIEKWLDEAKNPTGEEDETPDQYSLDLERYLETPESQVIYFACTPEAFPPVYSDGVYEITCPRKDEPILLEPKTKTKIHTGIFFEMAPGYYIETKEKAGLAIMKSIVSVMPEGGVIDNDYTGELIICLQNDSDEIYHLRPKDKFAQFVVKKQPFHFLKDISETQEKSTKNDACASIETHAPCSTESSSQEAEEEEEDLLEEGEIAEAEEEEKVCPKKSWDEQVAEENERDLLRQLESLKKTTAIQYIKAFPGAYAPEKGTPDAAGYDLKIPENSGKKGNGKHVIVIRPNETKRISMGLIFQVPQGWYGEIRSRSGLAFKNDIKVFISLVTHAFRGSIAINVKNEGRTRYTFYGGDKCAQIIFQKVPDHILREAALCDITKTTQRGANGFGSTG